MSQVMTTNNMEFPLHGTVTRKISEKVFGSLLNVRFADGTCTTVSTDALGLTKGDNISIRSGTRKYWEAGKQWQLVKCKVDVIFDRIPESTATTQLLVKGLRKLFIKNVKGVGKAAADRLCNGGHLERLALNFLRGASGDHMITQLAAGLDGSAVAGRLVAFLKTFATPHRFLVEACFLALGNVRCHVSEVPELDRFLDSLLRKPYSERTLDQLGFLKCDELATMLELHNTEERLEAALFHCLTEAAKSEGHCYLPQEELYQKAKEMMGVSRPDAAEALKRCIGRGQSSPLVYISLGPEQPAVYRRRVCADEQAVARILRSFVARPMSAFHGAATSQLPCTGPTPSPDQLTAMEKIMSCSVSVLTGPPGSGKSLTIRWLTELAMLRGKTVQLLAPTGRAAARLREVSSEGDATTIHMWMTRKDHAPIDLIVVDETSMVDMDLLLTFLRACEKSHPTATLIFAGDVDQLPSIGAGNVLLDIIASNNIPVAALTCIHRQGAGSGILTLAFAVRAGDVKAVRACSNLTECSIVLRVNEDDVLAMVKQKCTLPENNDLQVITPCKMGPLGTESINRQLQQLLNGNVHIHGKHFRMNDSLTFALGDKVIACKNNHTHGVYNGDIGWVSEIAVDALFVNYTSGRVQEYKFGEEEIETLNLAYAITVHRTQGSEFPHTLILMPNSAWKMATQRLLYTAVTRSKLSCTIFGIKDILMRAIANPGSSRYTRLASLLA